MSLNKFLNIIYSALLLFIILSIEVQAQYVGKIYIDRRDAFDTLFHDDFFASGLANSLHVVTKEYFIEDECLFQEGDELDEKSIYETERNLRNLGIFSQVKVELKPAKRDDYDVYITTQDRFSLDPALLFGSGGNSYNLGGGLREWNLLGTGTFVNIEALYRSENGIGWQGYLQLHQRRLFRSVYSIDASILSNKIKTDQSITLAKQFLSLSTENSYGVGLVNSFGSIYNYVENAPYELLTFRRLKPSAFYAQSWRSADRVFMTGLVEMDNVNRGKPEFAQAYDNSGRILLGFSSVSEEYTPVNKINTYLTEDLCIGGWGTAVVGVTFKTNSGGENLFYLGAQGENSVNTKNLYLFGQVSGSSSFSKAKARFTYQEFLGTAFYNISPGLLLAARVRQQSVWNWYAKRQLLLDNDAGLRGYKLNELVGDNRFINNLELRYFPEWGWSFLKLSFVAFSDFGTVWNQQTALSKTRWHSSVGLGFRIHNMKASKETEVVRFDFAYNFDKMQFGSIIVSSGQLFSAFTTHKYKLPEIYGLEYDDE
jgi:hypothetical protein